MGEIVRGYRPPEPRYFGDDRNREIVAGRVFTTNHPYVIKSLPPPQRSQDLAPYFRSKYDLDFQRRDGKLGGRGGSLWCFSDPELRRRKRVAGYKAYSAEGKLKAKIRRGLRWIKVRCHELVHGY